MAKNPKMVICKNCNAPIAENAKVCTSCGIKNKAPFYKRWWFILIVVVVLLGVIGSIGGKSNKKTTVDRMVDYKWPNSDLGSLIPQPESKYGKVSMESEDYLLIEVYDTSKGQFEEYIDDCKTVGFTVNYSKYDDYYSADNEDGYSLNLSYNTGEETLRISLNAPKEEPEEISTSEESVETANDFADEESDFANDASNFPEDENTSAAEQPDDFNEIPDGKSEEGDNATKLVDGMRKEFKEAMDSYEAFFDEYVAFMKKYSESSDTTEMMMDYLKYVEKYTEAMTKLDEMGEQEMNDAELKYYTEVMLRINQKIIDVIQ